MLTQSGLLRIFPGTAQRAQCSELEDINLPGSQGFSLSLHPPHPPPKLSQWLGSEIREVKSIRKHPSLLGLVKESSGKREKGRCVCLCVCAWTCMHARTHMLLCMFMHWVLIWVFNGHMRISVCTSVMYKVHRQSDHFLPLSSHFPIHNLLFLTSG